MIFKSIQCPSVPTPRKLKDRVRLVEGKRSVRQSSVAKAQLDIHVLESLHEAIAHEKVAGKYPCAVEVDRPFA